MNRPALPFLPFIRRHRLRLLTVEFINSSYWPALVASGVLLVVALISQWVPVAQRHWVVVSVVALWLGVSMYMHRRRWHHIAVSRRLDAAFGWQSALTTAIEYAHHDDVVCRQQRQHTLAHIKTTPAHVVPIPFVRVWSGWLVMVICVFVLWLVPTPFDQQITMQQQVRAVARTTAESLTALPPIAEMQIPSLQQQITQATDAQALLATLTQAESTLDRAQTVNQTFQNAINEAMDSPLQTPDPATLAALTDAQRRQLADAIAAEQQGDSGALQRLQADTKAQSQSLAAWQQALGTQADIARANAPEQFALSNPQQGGNQQGGNQQGGNQQGGNQQGGNQQGGNQQGGNQQGGNQQGGNQQGGNQQGGNQQGGNQQGGNQQGGNQQGGNQQGGNQQGGNQQGGNQQGGNQQGGNQQGGNQQGGNQQGGNQQGGNQQGGNQQGGNQQGGAGAGTGTGTGRGDDSVSMFLPTLSEGNIVEIPTTDDQGSREVQERDTVGGTQSAQITYADVVDQASQRANQAIDAAQIPWTSEGIVRDYFRQLQGDQP